MDKGMLAETVENIADICDEIIVIDTSPKPLKIDAGKKVAFYRAKHLGYPDLYRAWAFQKCKNRWIFLVDTDERLTDGFRNHISKVVKKAESGGYSGITISRVEGAYRDEDWSKMPKSTIMRIFKKTDATSSGNLHDIIRINGKVLDATDSLILLHLKREKLNEKYRVNYRKVDVLRRLSYRSLLKRFRLPLIFKSYMSSKRPISSELGNFDYTLWYLMLNIKLALIEKGNPLKSIYHTVIDLENIRTYKRDSSEELFYAIDEANDIGVTRYLGLDKEKNIKALSHKHMDGITLLLALLRDEYKRRHKIGGPHKGNG